jgi:carbonic anhydrase
MDRRHLLTGLLGLALCPLCAPRGFAAEGAHWSYEGAAGPANWGTLSLPDNVCSTGTQQSPLKIGDTVPARLPSLGISWRKPPDTIENNGHTIQLNFAAGSTLTLGDRKYALVQFHFHRPSEHLIKDKNFPMEAHFVHRHDSGDLAVIGVLMTTGRPNAVFRRIAGNMPAHEGPPVKAPGGIDPNGLLPARRSYYRYEGSLTTPPCKEIVNWLVLTESIQVAEDDVAAFAKLYPDNARPAQDAHRRFILRSA